MISYGGLLKEVHKELNLDDAEDGDFVHIDDVRKFFCISTIKWSIFTFEFFYV